jgi:tetratricopeptide (TPR) repeat protein
MEEFALRAKAEGFDPRLGRVIEFGGDPLSMLVRNLMGAGAGAQPEQLAQALEKAPVTAELRRFLADMTGGQLPGLPRGGEDDADGSRRQAGRQSALKELVRSLAARQPLLIVVEDIHSATPLTLESLAWIASTTRSSPTLLALTTRTQGDPITPAWRNACSCALTTIDLGPLAEAEALRMAAHYPSPDEGFAHACARRSEGNPLFLDQLMRAGQGSGAVPGSLQNLILARLDRLEEKERQALQVASVLGQRFPRAALQHLLNDPAYAMDRVRDEGLVRDEGEDLAFSHALIQEAVYGSLLRGRRLDLHTAAARWYDGRDAVLRARHLGTAGDAGAFDAFMEAARLEAAAYRIEHALELIGRALAFATTDRQRCDLVLMRGEFQRDHGQTARSVQSFGEGLHLAQEDAQRLRAWIGIASGLRTLDLYERALAALDNAQRFAHALGDRKALMNIQSLRGHVYFPLGNMEACLGAHEEARRLATEVGAPADEARALGGLGDAYYQNARILTSRVYVERCIALSRQHGLTRIEINHLPMLGIVRLYCNEIEDGLAACAEALAMATRIGDVRSEVLARLVMASLHQSAGRNEDCLSECERARSLSRPLGAARFEADALTGLGLSCHFLGRAVEARRYLDQAHAMVEQTGPSYTGPWVLAAIALASDDEDVCRKALARGEAQLALGCVSHNYFHFYQIAIEVAREMGQREEMLRYADALERYTAQEPLPWTGFVIARARALARYLGNDRSAGLKSDLHVLRESADRIGLRMALPGIDDALAAF